MTTDFPIAAAAGRSIILNVRPLMASRKIRTVAELGRLLDGAGVEISPAQLLRIVDNKCKLWNVEVLTGLLHVLECRVSDLVTEGSPDIAQPEVAR